MGIFIRNVMAFLPLQLSIGGSKQIIWFPSGGAIPQNESKLKVFSICSRFLILVRFHRIEEALKAVLYFSCYSQGDDVDSGVIGERGKV